MLTVIVGGTSEERLKARLAAAQGASVEELDTKQLSEGELAARAGTAALFGGPQAFLIRNAFCDAGEDAAEEENQEPETKNTDAKAALFDIAPGLAESPHTFILEEEKLLAPIKSKLMKAGADMKIFDKPATKEALNVFAIADAFGRGDKKTFWLLLTGALRQGIAPENIAGILAWKARTMLASARSAKERARYGALSRGLVVMYHDSHRGAGDLGLLLEKFTLEM